MRAIIEIYSEDEEQEQKKYDDNMREHLKTMISEEGEDETVCANEEKFESRQVQ